MNAIARRTLLAGAAAAGTTAAFPTTARAGLSTDPHYQAEPMRSVQPDGTVHCTRMGCLRLGQDNAWGRPYWHVNSAHTLVGFDPYASGSPIVELDSTDRLVVRGANVDPNEQIGSITLATDESMAEKGITLGPSGAVPMFVIELYKPTISGSSVVHQRVSPRSSSTFGGDSANIWVTVHSRIPA